MFYLLFSIIFSEANQTLFAYVHDYYKTETLRGLYSIEVMPVSHPKDWAPLQALNLLVIKPPDNPRQAGRPKLKRTSSAGESGCRTRKQRCSRCLQHGHNRTRCTNDVPLEPAPASISASNEVNQGEQKAWTGRRKCTKTNCPTRASDSSEEEG